MSAAVPRAIMPISVLLPTPLPPKMPMRWPRPQVRKPSMARMPQLSGSRIGTRSSGSGAEPSMVTEWMARYSPLPSSGFPAVSITRPSISGPDANRRARAPGHDLVAKANSLRLVGGHRQHRRSAKADDLAGITASAGADDLARFADKAERTVRLNQIADHLIDAAPPPQCRAGLEIVRVWSQQMRGSSIRRPQCEQIEESLLNFL